MAVDWLKKYSKADIIRLIERDFITSNRLKESHMLMVICLKKQEEYNKALHEHMNRPEPDFNEFNRIQKRLIDSTDPTLRDMERRSRSRVVRD